MKFKNIFSHLTAIAVSLFVLASAHAEDEPPSPWTFDLGAAFLSDYMFRGIERYDGFSIQPALTATYQLTKASSISAGAWAQLPGQGEKGAGSFKKVDYSLIYDLSSGPGTLSFGHYWYTYARDHSGEFENTSELYAGLALDALLTPTFGVYKDYQKYGNFYYEFSLSEKIESASFGEDISFTPFISSGFTSRGEEVYGRGGLVELTYGIYFEEKIGEVIIIPVINYTRAYDSATDDNWWGGVSLSYIF